MLTPYDVTTSPLAPGITAIEASAGTGKTYSLVQTVVEALFRDETLKPEQVLLVTFTNAARDELSERLRVALAQADSDPLRAARARALRLAGDGVTVSTIHGFCGEVLVQEAFAAGTPLALDLVTDAAAIIDEAVGSVWRRLHEQHPELLVLDDPWTPKQAGKAVAEILGRPGLKLASSSADVAPACVALRAAHAECRVLAPAAADLEALTWNKGGLGDATAKASFARCLTAPEVSAVSADDLRLATNIADPKYLNKRGQKATVQRAIHDASPLVQALRGLAAALQRLRRAWSYAVAATAASEVGRLLAAARCRTTDDLLTDVERALTTSSTLADRLSERFRLVCIDEFQDTDARQWRIFSTCFGRNGGRLLLIGDPKQAIYAFRGADVRVFQRASATAQATYGLSTNRRSHPHILAGVDALFSGRDPYVGAITHPPGTALPVPPWRMGQDQPAVCAWLAAAPDAASVLRATAREIRRLLSAGTFLTAADGRQRPLHAGDCAVLVSRNADAEAAQRALAGEGIAAIIRSPVSILGSQVAEELAHILSAMLSLRDARRVRAALTTQIWGATAEYLLTSPTADVRWEHAVQLLSDGRQTWRLHGVARACEQVLEALDVWRRIAAWPAGDRWLTDLRHLIELAAQAEHEGLAPERMATWLRRGDDDESTTEVSRRRLESDAQRVRIMTIHGAKGLEFPLVFCPLLWADRPRRQVSGSSVTVPDGDGWRLFVNHDELDDATREQWRAHELGERSRLLYVALTRAQARLHVVLPSAEPSTGDHHKNREWHTVRLATALGWQMLGPAQRDAGALVEAVVRGKYGQDEEPMRPDMVKAYQQGLNAWLTAGRDAGWLAVSDLDDIAAAVAEQPAATVPPAGCFAVATLPQPSRDALFSPWRIASFTSLAGHAAATALRDPEAPAPASVDEDTAGPPSLLAGFPGGAAFGECLHDVLEHWNPQQPADSAAVARHLAAHGFAADGTRRRDAVPAVTVLLDRLAVLPLQCAQAKPLQLSASTMPQRRAEWRFHLALGRLVPEQLAHVVARCDPAFHQRYAATFANLGSRSLQGFLTGSIDLVVEHGESLHVIDWKSNRLGDSLADYVPERLDAALNEARYPLQAVIYLVALRRWLRTCGVDPDQCLGGAWYIFLRGLGSDASTGIATLQPNAALLAAIDMALEPH